MVQRLAKQPAVEKAIRQVAQETGVPAGLLAGLCHQESSIHPNAVSDNPTPDDPRDVGITQAPEPDFDGGSWRDPPVNLRLSVTKYFLPAYHKYGNWGEPLRIWNNDEVLDPNDLTVEHNNTDPNYISEILATHCMGLD